LRAAARAKITWHDRSRIALDHLLVMNFGERHPSKTNAGTFAFDGHHRLQIQFAVVIAL
jgi:hypothetical protein